MRIRLETERQGRPDETHLPDEPRGDLERGSQQLEMQPVKISITQVSTKT